SPRERADAVARMQENSLIVQWVQQCLERRVSSYRWALERLVLQAPDTMAADADRLIGELAAQTANPPVQARPVIEPPATTKGCRSPDFQCRRHRRILRRTVARLTRLYRASTVAFER